MLAILLDCRRILRYPYALIGQQLLR